MKKEINIYRVSLLTSNTKFVKIIYNFENDVFNIIKNTCFKFLKKNDNM